MLYSNIVNFKVSEKLRKQLLKEERGLRKKQPKAWTLKYRQFARPIKTKEEKDAEEANRPDWARADYKTDDSHKKKKKVKKKQR